MNTRTHLKTALIVFLLIMVAWLVYGRYQRSGAQERRLQQDTRLIDNMLTENNAQRP